MSEGRTPGPGRPPLGAGVRFHAERMVALMRERGLNRHTLAAQLVMRGIRTNVDRFIAGQGVPRVETLYHLSKVLGCSMERLLDVD